jgi:hypothetical protein
MKLRTVLAGIVVVGVAAIVGACSSGSAAGSAAEDGGCTEFDPLAVSGAAPAFDNFCNWNQAVATNDEDASDGLHGVGPLKVYWNNSPPHGSTTFPVGTIIVKESQEQDPTQRTAFAMTKRGCGYNTGDGGASGWEWWSLADNGNCTMTLLWRGFQAPATESYAGVPIGNCNDCHGMVVDNDFVWDSALQLSKF